MMDRSGDTVRSMVPSHFSPVLVKSGEMLWRLEEHGRATDMNRLTNQEDNKSICHQK